MTLQEYNSYCGAVADSTHVVRWGGQDVWKVGGEVFAIARHSETAGIEVTFKVGEIAFDVLPDLPGIRPAPYLASRGMKWVQHYALPGLSDDELCAHIKASYDMACDRLTKKLRKELGLG